MAYIKHEDLCGAFKGDSDAEFSQTFFFSFCVLHIYSLKYSFHHSSPACPSSSGDTLLAIRAPIGTQLEVPIPEAVSYVCGILPVFIQMLLCLMSQTVDVFLSRSLTARGNTRFVSRVHLVPSRFCWSIRTRPVPLLLFCPSLLQMMSFKASQHQHLPLCRPLLSPRST